MGMDNADVFDFRSSCAAPNRIIDRTFPREAAKDEFQAAELQERAVAKRADDITSAATRSPMRVMKA